MPIDSKHPMYDAVVARACLVRDVLVGDIRDKRYIPDIDYRDQRRCKLHRKKGVMVNFTRRTLQSFLGLIFKTAPVVQVPPLLEYVNTDTTGNKLTIEQFARECCREVFTAGAVGVFVDYPDAPKGVDQVTQEQLGLKARLYMYVRESYGNWFTYSDSGSDELQLVVLKEAKNTLGPDGYEWKSCIQYRVLKINKDGWYEVDILNEKGVSTLPKPHRPKANGKYQKTIPFFVAGAEINDINAENIPPLYGMAELNIGHLRNSCDFEFSASLVGMASLFFTSSITPSIMMEKVKNKPITLSSDKGHYLGESGQPYLVQARETSMATQGMKDKLDAATMMGASILMPHSGTIKTAEATKMDKGSEVSVIETVISNVEEMLTLATKKQAEYMGADPKDIDITLNHELIELSADPQVMAQIAAWVVQGLLPKFAAQNYVRDTGVLDTELTNEELDAMIAAEDPLAGMGNALYPAPIVKPNP